MGISYAERMQLCLKNCQGLWNLVSDIFKGKFPSELKLVSVSINVCVRMCMSTFYFMSRLH